MLQLNDCPQCKKHVYVPWSKRKSCPRCVVARFDTDGKPKELVYYFPVASKLKALLKDSHPVTKIFYNMNSFVPGSNEEVMSDVYDAPAWKEFMGKLDQGFNTSCRVQKRGIFKGVWQGDAKGPLKWRLTKEQVELLDERMGRVCWPHHVDRINYRGCSFWAKRSRLWKTHRKIILFYFIQATQLRYQLPRLHVALFKVIWALRRLGGQAGTQLRDGYRTWNTTWFPSC